MVRSVLVNPSTSSVELCTIRLIFNKDFNQRYAGRYLLQLNTCRCNVLCQDCPPGSTDFREYQCSQFNGKHFNIHGLTTDVKWVAKYSGSK